MQIKVKKLLCSDHHFFHDKILEFGVRGKLWNTIKEHNEALVEKHNQTVAPDDHVFFGGDLILSVPGEEKELLAALHDTVGKMNGKKYLIPGNHCTPAKMKAYYQSGLFHAIAGYWEFNKDIFFSHVPVHESQIGRWKINVHGHVHEHTLDDQRYFNVSMEAINYTPIDLEEVYERKRKIYG